MKLKKIEWSEVQEPDDECHYHHVTGWTPFGTFLLTWKGWKDYFDPSFDDGPLGFCIPDGRTVEECQQWAETQLLAKIQETLE